MISDQWANQKYLRDGKAQGYDETDQSDGHRHKAPFDKQVN